MYPVITMGEGAHMGSRDSLLGKTPSPHDVDFYSCQTHVTREVPPTFIALSADDETVPPGPNGIAMFNALQAAKVPSELHAFQEGGHGFGIRLAKGKPCAAWPELLLRWGWRGGWFRDASASA
jgi:acetyl esterase/lipase